MGMMLMLSVQHVTNLTLKAGHTRVAYLQFSCAVSSPMMRDLMSVLQSKLHVIRIGFVRMHTSN